jgi:hypothetical protein
VFFEGRSMTDAPTTNRKPADRLAEIRERIRTLEAEEATLRAGFIAGEFSLEGERSRNRAAKMEMERRRASR